MAAVVFGLIMLFSLVLAVLARRGHRVMNIDQYLVGGRSFSGFLLFFLAVGEIYSIGTMIGFPGGIYADGASYGIWFLGYILLAYPVGYFLAPLIWRAGHRYKANTVPDLFKGHYSHRGLELVVTISSIIFAIPWAQLQFSGLEVAMSALGFHWSPATTVIISSCIAFLYIAVSGVKAPAFISILKDVAMLFAIVIVGFAVLLAIHGIPHLFAVARMRGDSVDVVKRSDMVFALSTIFFQSLGFYLNAAPMIFTARSEATVKKTQTFMPLYMMMYPFLVMASYFALIVMPHLHQPDNAFMAVVVRLMPSWLIGVVAAGAALSGILVLAVYCLGLAAQVSRNLMPNVPERAQTNWVRMIVVAYLLLSMGLTLLAPTLMLTLINTAYYGFTQLFPGFLAMFFFRRLTPVGIAAGIIVGDISVLALYVTHANLFNINIGLIALVINFVVTLVVSAVTRSAVPTWKPVAHVPERVETGV
ncbi:sodium:solute symporter family protein [Alicyclobacillus cycloheptanicus]|uniref:SSS family solute:Na+ symporter n=1 Tax=Alicyclobacillus cycloheptanicus TaxID=1457 RepID=A0ABT9XNX1_9BACL|nr:sodium:solute symporter family protein [Alicyclobacillus cycloheptanicus]MDQ0191448.1 SSS family solute:Na+ symporter [Alicyclobacillus cycloheptanicus]WDM00788.1 sodium:solute symporter family protein [Alicyclobacillus cycloheptanicus]